MTLYYEENKKLRRSETRNKFLSSVSSQPLFVNDTLIYKEFISYTFHPCGTSSWNILTIHARH